MLGLCHGGKKTVHMPAYFVNEMLRAKNIDKIKFCMLYESMDALPVQANFGDGTLAIDKFTSDMLFFRDTYFGHPSYLHINGRPIVYVYVTRFWKNFEPLMLDKIKTAVGKDILFIADDPFFGHNTDPATAQNGIKDGKPVFEAYTAYNMYENELVREGERAVDYMLREALPIYEKWSRTTVFFPHVLPKYHDFR
jgi:glycoprotein endo-alpha-1,2-mannosidase